MIPDEIVAELYQHHTTGMSLRAISGAFGVNRDALARAFRGANLLVLTEKPCPVGQVEHEQTAGARRATDAALLRADLAGHPGSTLVQSRVRVGLSGKRAQGAVIHDPALRDIAVSPAPRTGVMPADQALAAIRDVAALLPAGQPVSQAQYDNGRDWTRTLASARLAYRFGSWTAACVAAGVPTVDHTKNAASTVLRWTDEDLHAALCAFFLNPASARTQDAYSRWRKHAPAAPAAATLIGRFGVPWGSLRHLGSALAAAHIDPGAATPGLLLAAEYIRARSENEPSAIPVTDPDRLRSVLHDPVRYLIGRAIRSGPDGRLLDDDQVLEGIRVAARAADVPGGPLSPAAYETYRDPASSLCYGALRARFGSWPAALIVADVRPAGPVWDRVAEQAFRDALPDYFADPAARDAYAGFRTWARRHPEHLGAGFTRHRCGTWAVARKLNIRAARRPG